MTTTAPTRVQLPVVPALSLKRDTLAEARKLIEHYVNQRHDPPDLK